MRYYRVLKEVSLRRGLNRDVATHDVGELLSEEQVDEYVRSKIAEGDLHYRALFQPLTDSEAFELRPQQTAQEGEDSEIDGHDQSEPASDGDATPPHRLRWADTNPNNAQHVTDLEDRLASLERRFPEIQQTRASSEIEPA
jgi:hypothetical protein